MKILFLITYICISISYLYGEIDFTSKNLEEERAKESERIFQFCKKNINYYELKPGQHLQDITEKLLASPDVEERHKSMMRLQQRRIIVFKYLSDGITVKGYISFTPNYEKVPLLVFLRGGNRILGLMNPSNDFSFAKDYTVIATTYRGGMNEGCDEFGGDEVCDVENLVRFIPKLESMLKMKLSPPKKYILGASRGGMEMFLALQRSTYLQNYFDKAVSLSGPTDLNITIQMREGMKNMFIEDFGLKLDENASDWLSYRSPIQHCSSLRKDLPLLLIQGTEDRRVQLDHGRNMFAELTRLGNHVNYWEIKGANHCLNNQANKVELILGWLEQDTEMPR